MTTLQIRDQRARELAHRLAKRRNVTMTEAVVQALEQELRRDEQKEPLAAKLRAIALKLANESEGTGRVMPRAEIDEMWGH